MTHKTRYILTGIPIGVLTTLASIALIVVLSIDWNAKVPHKPYIPIYPNSSNSVRTVRYELDPNVFITSGTLLDQTTTFQTTDKMNEILVYYQIAYRREYKCDSSEAHSTTTYSAFTCIRADHNITTGYIVEITISPTSSSAKTVSVSEVHRVRSNDQW